MADLRIKRGDTLALSILAKDDAGAVYDLTGCTVTCQVRDAGNALVEDLAVTNGGATGLLTIEEPATSGWPTGILTTDLRIAFPGGKVAHTETMTLTVSREVTAAPA